MNENQQETMAPAEISKLAQAIEETMRALTVIMEEELNLLSQRKMEAMLALREEKAKHLRAYQSHIIALSREPMLLKKAPEETRVRLRRTGEILAEAARRNAVGFRGAITATQSVLKVVVDAAIEKTNPAFCYTDPRKKETTKKKYSPTNEPVAINQKA